MILRINNYVILFILICTGCLGVCLPLITVCAQSSDATLQPVVSLPPRMTEGPVPGGVISGYVLDEDGKPVSRAVVTLWQNGQIWQPLNYALNACVNPQETNIAYSNKYGYLKEGSFEFGLLYPGEYTLTVEKDGYKDGSANIHIGNDTMRQTILDPGPPATIVNITLSGYYVPTLTPEQLAYNGSIAGTLRSAYGPGVEDVNVSLWQDGRMINRPDNPQSSLQRNFSGKSVDYLFEHVAPGRYTVRAEYIYPLPYNDTVSVDVGTDAATADIILSHVVPTRPSTAPTQVATPSKPTPALPGLVVLLVIGFVIYYKANKK